MDFRVWPRLSSGASSLGSFFSCDMLRLSGSSSKVLWLPTWEVVALFLTFFIPFLMSCKSILQICCAVSSDTGASFVFLIISIRLLLLSLASAHNPEKRPPASTAYSIMFSGFLCCASSLSGAVSFAAYIFAYSSKWFRSCNLQPVYGPYFSSMVQPRSQSSLASSLDLKLSESARSPRFASCFIILEA